MMAAQIYISVLFCVYQSIYVLIVVRVATLMAVTSSQDGFHMPGDWLVMLNTFSSILCSGFFSIDQINFDFKLFCCLIVRFFL